MTAPVEPLSSSTPAPRPRSRLAAMLQRPGLRRFGRVAAKGAFWSWNVVFLCVFYLGLLPMVLWDLLREAIMGLVPWDFLFFSAVLLLIPLLCTVLGALRLRAAPVKLLALLLGIEGPLVMLCLFRLFLVRELQPAAAQVLLSFYVGIHFYAYELFCGTSSRKRTLDAQLLGHALHLCAGLYLGAWLGLYSPPILFSVLSVILSFSWVRGLFDLLRSVRFWELIFVPLSGALFLYTALLLAGSPLGAIVLSVRGYRRVAQAHAAAHGRVRTALLSVLVLGASAVLFVILNRQPQGTAFALLAQQPRDAAAEQALLRQSGVIRAGLLNAYLAQYRYLDTTERDRLLSEIYQSVFHTSTREVWAPLQAVHRSLAAPFLYQGDSTYQDQGRAEELYEQFFDAPLQKTERAAVLRALEATYSQEGREAGLLNVGQRKVRLVRQEVQVVQRGDVAEVELYEVYENQTYQPQEIFYYFTLPESAAVTGLWLGQSADRAQRFQPVVAPRGAAQRVYKAEVAQRLDPALLEEIGPRQYRLRAFPVPQRPELPHSKWAWLKRQVLDPATSPKLHLWLTYAAFADERGVPLPEITERRNIYRDGSTERLVAGQRVPGAVEWLPDHAAVGGTQAAAAHDIALKEGYQVHVQPGLSSPALPRGQTLAVVVDRSRSMERVGQQLGDALRWLRGGQGQSDALGATNRLDLYLTAAATRPSGPRRIDHYSEADIAEAVRPYGGMRVREALQQLRRLRGDTAYAAIFLLTDDGSLDLARDEAPPDLGAPLFIAHVGGRLAPGYDDGTLHAVQQRGGGVATSIQEAVRRYAEGTAGASMDGRYFTAQQAEGAGADPAGPLQALAARQVILHQLRDVRPADPATLEPLHGLAKAYSVVSPLSSLLVLVEDRQRERLRQEEQKQDRFDRQVESGKEALPHVGGGFGLTAAPEPAEWLLCALAAAVLGWSRRRRAAQRSGGITA